MRTGALRIGISACFLHADPSREFFRGKTLLYMEQSLGHWLMSTGAVAMLLPTVPQPALLPAMLDGLDALVLHGGADVAPETYGETPLQPQWHGDAIRDAYEIALLRTCMQTNKPILGVCRGMQLMNVALGGTLWQDIATQRPQSLMHRHAEQYDQLFHPVQVLPDTGLQALYPGQQAATINSVHHQGLKDVAKGLQVEARAPDGVVEAVRWTASDVYLVGVQWHPEYHDVQDSRLLHGKPLLDEFLHQAALRRR